MVTFEPLLRTWVAVVICTSCVFFNGWVFYHPGGDFYTMGCYKIQKNITKIKKLTDDQAMQPMRHHAHHSGSE